MRVILLDIQGYGPTFLAEDREKLDNDAPPDPRPGFWSWLAARRHKISQELEKTTGVVGPTIGRVWRSMQRLVAPDEYLLRQLRKAWRLTIDHPVSLEPEAVQQLWKAYLRWNLKKHGAWFVVDALLAPMSLFLMIIPGPNVFGYWVLYRAIIHGLVFLGAWRAWKGRLATKLRALDGLDGPISSGDHERLEDLAQTLSWPDFGLLVERIAPDPNSQ